MALRNTVDDGEPEPETACGARALGFDPSKEETNWLNPKFYALCIQDLRDMVWPTPKSVIQTVVTSQIAFIVIFISIIVFDAFAEATVRTLLQGKPFVLMLDGSASPTRGI